MDQTRCLEKDTVLVSRGRKQRYCVPQLCNVAWKAAEPGLAEAAGPSACWAGRQTPQLIDSPAGEDLTCWQIRNMSRSRSAICLTFSLWLLSTLIQQKFHSRSDHSCCKVCTAAVRVRVRKVCFLLRRGPLPQLGPADGRVSEPSFTWKIVARETSKETCNTGDSFVPRTPPREAPLSPSASDELPANPASKKKLISRLLVWVVVFSARSNCPEWCWHNLELRFSHSSPVNRNCKEKER